MAFQVARVGDEPGAGRGILLYRFGAVREERKALEQALDG
jgi:hypothetical protein